MKMFVAGASLAAIVLASSAIAQTSPSPGSPTPAERAPSTSAPSTAPSMPAARPSAPSTSSSALPSSSIGQWRASKLVGTAVYNQANERIGDINEILIDNSGKVSGVVLGVGGFLGMGEHEVAVPFADLQIAQDGASMKVVSSYTKQSLTSMPQWRWDNSAASGAGTASGR